MNRREFILTGLAALGSKVFEKFRQDEPLDEWLSGFNDSCVGDITVNYDQCESQSEWNELNCDGDCWISFDNGITWVRSWFDDLKGAGLVRLTNPSRIENLLDIKVYNHVLSNEEIEKAYQGKAQEEYYTKQSGCNWESAIKAGENLPPIRDYWPMEEFLPLGELLPMKEIEYHIPDKWYESTEGISKNHPGLVAVCDETDSLYGPYWNYPYRTFELYEDGRAIEHQEKTITFDFEYSVLRDDKLVGCKKV